MDGSCSSWNPTPFLTCSFLIRFHIFVANPFSFLVCFFLFEMAENLEKSLLNFSPDDEDYVSCQICLNNFDENERIPKFLESCHHFFCLPCINVITLSITWSLFYFQLTHYLLLQGLVNQRGRKKILCPTCRVSSTFTKAKFEDLVTNHVALRLLQVVTAVETDKAKKEKYQEVTTFKNLDTWFQSIFYYREQQWCVDCTAPSSKNCLLNKHHLQNLNDFQNSCMSQLKTKISQTNVACDKALEDYKKIQSAHQVIIAWIRWLQLEITHRDASNTSSIARLESLKMPETFHAETCENEDMQSIFNRVEELTEQ